MWVFTRDSFVSIVRDRDDALKLHVRARVAGDIERIWHSASVTATPKADYQFRASLPEAEVAQALVALLAAIDYTTDFKGGVHEKRRHDVYLRIWDAARRLAT